jgi:hypothetical protein
MTQSIQVIFISGRGDLGFPKSPHLGNRLHLRRTALICSVGCMREEESSVWRIGVGGWNAESPLLYSTVRPNDGAAPFRSGAWWRSRTTPAQQSPTVASALRLRHPLAFNCYPLTANRHFATPIPYPKQKGLLTAPLSLTSGPLVLVTSSPRVPESSSPRVTWPESRSACTSLRCARGHHRPCCGRRPRRGGGCARARGRRRRDAP